jgi:diguanylate cyclase (GGDEF)-like protein
MQPRHLVYCAGAAAVAATGTLAPGSTAAVVVYDVAAVCVAAVVWRGASRPARDRRTWLLLAGGMTAWCAGDLTWDAYTLLGAERPAVSWADVSYLLGYPLFALGIARLVRLRAPAQYRETLLDGTALAIAAAAAAYEYLVVPTTRHAGALESVVWGAYPLADVLLLAGAAWLLLSPGQRTRSVELLAAFLGANLVLDLAYAALPLAVPTFDLAFVDPFYPASYGLLALAVVHPSAHDVTNPSTAVHRVHPARMAFLGCALVSTPVLSLGIATPGGQVNRVLLVAIAVALAATVMVRFLIAVRERESAQAELAHRAAHDPLTGLCSRPLLVERLGDALDRCRRRGTTLGVLYVDLDRFKPVNDTWGHTYGDAVLVAVAERLRAAVRPTDLVARVGGDEFVVVCEEVAGTTDAEQVAQRIIDVVAQPVDTGERTVMIAASVGIALDDGNAGQPEELVQDADAAMYLAKQRGRRRYEHYDRRLRELLDRRADVEAGLRLALDRRELELRYQPIFDVEDEQVVGFEALLRWRRPGHDVLAPGEFVGIAEETGLIVPIGAWVLEEACRTLAQWNARRAAPLWVSVNVSPRQLADPSFAATVGEVLERTGVEPERLVLEITESVLVHDVEGAVPQLDAIHAAGTRIAVDDFGTGYSALAYLRQLPIDILKIDRQFMRELGTLAPASTLVAAVVNLARVLGHAVVAEGVETPAQRQALRLLGCELAQGFDYAPPLTRGDAARLAGGELAHVHA